MTFAEDLIVRADGVALWRGRAIFCAIGRAGILAEKREGDLGTPLGRWPMREVFYRPDRIGRFEVALPCRALHENDGWCDAPADPAYNRLVSLPYPAHCERLWRLDGLYDLLVPLGYNDDPVRPGCGSAIFLHVARPDLAPTAGCIALDRADLLRILAEARPGSAVAVR